MGSAHKVGGAGPRGSALPLRGFTLVEVLVCAVLVVVGLVALVAAFGHESVVVQRGEDITLATFLADEIRDRAFGMAFSDVLDLDGVTYNPAILSTGASENLSSWAQRITVTPVAPGDLNQTVSVEGARAARLAVEVFAKGNHVLTQTYYVLFMGGVPMASLDEESGDVEDEIEDEGGDGDGDGADDGDPDDDGEDPGDDGDDDDGDGKGKGKKK